MCPKFYHEGMFPRRRILLRFVELAGGQIERLRLMKLMFLYSANEDSPSQTRYQFVPYKLGPFSFLLYRDWSLLKEVGMTLEPDQHHFSLTEEGRAYARALNDEATAMADSVHTRWSATPTSVLINYVYKTHEWYASRSERGQHQQNPTVEDQPFGSFFSVGYQSLSIDAFLDLLMRNGVRNLVDTRFTPASRVYGYHTRTLAKLCEDVGIDYSLEDSLGVPRNERPISHTVGSVRQFERAYAEILRQNDDAVMRVATLAKAKSTAIMCYEADVNDCHRRLLGLRLQRATGLPIVELRDARLG